MDSKSYNIQTAFENDYNEIMNGFYIQSSPIIQNPEWKAPTDFITKFSLYQDIPNSITSTDTLSNIGI